MEKPTTIKEVAHHMVGLSESLGTYADKYGLDEEDLQNQLIEEGIESCNVCGCWTAEGDYDFPNGHDAVCLQCVESDDNE